jgi:hypothetical protein
MAISLTGSSTGQNFYKVLSNNVGDRAFTASPSNEIVIEYLDNDQLVQVLSASVNDIFSVSYENWDGKDLGSTGWYLGNSGNAIFSNVAVRGRIEATEGVIEGGLSLGGSLTASTNVGQIILSSSGIFGSTASGSFNLNTISGQINITGQINAKSGEISYLTVGDNNFPILNIVGASWVKDFLALLYYLFINTLTTQIYHIFLILVFSILLQKHILFKDIWQQETIFN